MGGIITEMITTDRILLAFKKRFGELVTRKKENEGKTQKEIAQEIGIGEKAMTAYLRDVDRLPRADALLMIADYFGISVDNLLGRARGRTASNEEIHKRLGLSDEAITRLEAFQSDPERWELALNAVDMLLADERGNAILTAIDNFLFSQFDAVYPVRRESTVDESSPLSVLAVSSMHSGGPVNVAISPELLRDAFLRDITNGLYEMRQSVEEAYTRRQLREADSCVNPENRE